MLKGKALSKNSIIGIVAPASKDNKDIIKRNIDNFLNLGFKIKLRNSIYCKNNLFAGDDIQRCKDIEEMFLDKSVDGIVCLRGGYGSIRLLDYLNPSIIINNPKFFCGYSDITVLLNYFSALGLITFHGPMINSNFLDRVTLYSFLNMITTNSPNLKYNLNNLNSISYINGKSFTGTLVGGNLTVLCSMIGSDYLSIPNDPILLLEDVNESPYVIDRLLTQLINSKIIKKCSGIITGYFSNKNNFLYEKVIIDRLMNFNIPIILGFPFGHSYPNLTIPIGAKASFNYENKLLIFKDNLLN